MCRARNASLFSWFPEGAIECDYLLSVPRIKAHSQMRITLAVKNLLAAYAARESHNPCEGRRGNQHFSQLVFAAMWAALPPPPAFVDGIVRQAFTGAVKGIPFQFWPA